MFEIVTGLTARDLTTADRLLIAAANGGQIAYRHTDAAAVNMFLVDGIDVDQDTMRRLAVLIDNRFLSIEAISVDCPVEATELGKAVLR